MGQLTNQYVSSSFQGLLKMTDSTQGLTNTLQTIQTGDGDNSPLQMSLTEVNISGSFFINNVPITNGTNGTSGTSGSNGTDGTSGSNGSDGSSGTSGSNGSDGSSGTSGSDGSMGSSGTDGTSGSSGTDGSSGSSGTDGTSGSNGTDGSSGTSGLTDKTGLITTGSVGFSQTIGGGLNVYSTDINDGFYLQYSDVPLDIVNYTYVTPVGFVSQTTSGTTENSIKVLQSGVEIKSNITKISGSVNITGSLIVNGDTTLSGSLIGNTVNDGLIKIQSEANRIGSVQFNITGSSPISQSNLIFGGGGPTPGGPTPGNLTGSIVISGSNNILFGSARGNTLVTAGSYGYIGGNNNLVTTIPTLNTASLVRPTMNNNNFNGPSFFSFTTSSLVAPSITNNQNIAGLTINHQSGSANVTTNIIGGGAISSNANTTTLSANLQILGNIFGNAATTLNQASSSIQYFQNVGGGVTVQNNYSSSVSTAVNNINVNNNTFGGTGNIITVSGSNSANRRQLNSNVILGIGNRINSDYSTSTGGHLTATSLLGQNLIVSASNTSTTVGGTVIVGRYNATGSLQESSQDTVFVVGTGTSDGNRRNALRIDNNNNSNFTGSVNISGSLLLNGVAVAGSDRNGLITTGSIGGSQSITGSLSVNGAQSISGAANGLTITGNAGGLTIQSGSIQLNNNGQAQIINAGVGTNVMYVDATNKNFFFGNVPKATSGRFSGDTGNFIVSPTYAAFETGSNNILLGTGNIGLLSGSNNLRIGGEPNFGSSDYSDTLYIGGTGGVNTNIIQKSGASSPLQLGYNTQVTGSLNVSNGATITGSFSVSGNTQLNGNVDIQVGNLNVYSPLARFSGSQVDITGSLGILGSLNVSNGATITGSLNVSNGITLTGDQFKITDQPITFSSSFAIGTANDVSINYTQGVGLGIRNGNIQIGREAGQNFLNNPDTTGNFLFGQYGGQNFESGSGNVFLHTGGSSFVSGSNNTLVGRNYSTITGGTNNVILGGYDAPETNINDYMSLGNSVNSFITKRQSQPIRMSESLTITGSLRVSGDVMFASGSNKTIGTVALDGGNPGSATVSNSLVTANSIIFLTKQTFVHTNSRGVAVVSKGSGTFTISSGHNGDDDVVAYQIINPA